MDSADVLPHSLSSESNGDDNADRLEDALLWYAFRVFLILAILKTASGFLAGSLIVLADGFCSAASLAAVAALLLVHRESMRAADNRYPYGYGNRARLFLLVVFCLLGIATTYLVLHLLRVPGASYHKLRLVALLTPPASLVISVLALRGLVRASEESDRECIERSKALLKKALVVSGIALVAVVSGLLGWSRAEYYGTILVLFITLWVYVKSIYYAFPVLTDRSVPVECVANITRLARRASRGARIVDVKSRNVGGTTCIDVRTAFPPSATIAQANTIEQDIVAVLRREVRRVGEVTVYWDT